MNPNGKQLAFTRYVEEKSQIFILSMEGGEPVQLTTFKYGANNPKWSPMVKKLFSSSISLQELRKILF
jgi:Tol biopolymer transport system component